MIILDFIILRWDHQDCYCIQRLFEIESKKFPFFKGNARVFLLIVQNRGYSTLYISLREGDMFQALYLIENNSLRASASQYD